MEVIFRNVSFSYNDTPTGKLALNNVSVFLESNLIHGIIGPIGSGKSTMLELMNGITFPSKGEVLVGEYELTNKKSNFNFNDFRYDVGLVYQFPEKQFFCSTVGEEIAFSQKIFDPKNRNIKNKVKKVLKMVGLDETYIKRSPFELNGGEKRRVAIASVLISNPKLLILDEPTIGLDCNSKKRLMRLLKGLKTKYLKTIIIVTHDVDMLYEIVDDIVVLSDGKVIKTGNKIEVFNDIKLLDEKGVPVPNVVRTCNIIKNNFGIDLGYVENMNSLVRKITNVINEQKKMVVVNNEK